MKDDLESLGYMLIYFYKKGNLFNLNSTEKTANLGQTLSSNPTPIVILNNAPSNPNPNPVKPPKNQRVNLYLQYKMNFIPELVFGEDSPLCFIDYFNYLKYLPHGQIPDYRFLKSLFKNYLKSLKFDLTKFKYDWVQIMINENVNLGNLSLSLTKANADMHFSLKKDNSLEKSDSDKLNSLNPNEINNILENPDEFKLKLEPMNGDFKNNPNNLPKQRKSVLKTRGSAFINENSNEASKSNSLDKSTEKLVAFHEKNGKGGPMNGTNGIGTNGVKNMNGNGIYSSHDPENFTENMLNEGKRLSEQHVSLFE